MSLCLPRLQEPRGSFLAVLLGHAGGHAGARANCTAGEHERGSGQAPALTPATTDKAKYPIPEGESLAVSHKYTVSVNYY